MAIVKANKMAKNRLNPAVWFTPKTWTVIGIVSSIVLALASLIFSWMAVEISKSSLSEQKRQFNEVQSEKLTIQLMPMPHDPIQLTDIKLGPEGQVVMLPWRLTLSNTGQQRLSIVRYEISEGNQPGSRYYTGLNGGIWDRAMKPIDLLSEPISIEPGETRVYVIKIGMLTKPEVAKVLGEGVDLRTGIVTGSSKLLASKGLDLFGNEVELQQFGNGFVLTRLTSKATPRYWCQLTTGRNNVFIGSGNSSLSGWVPEAEKPRDSPLGPR